MFHELPDAVDGIDVTRWEALEPYFAELGQRPLSTADVPAWLADWSRLSELVSEAGALISIERSQDTESAERREAYLHLVREIVPKLRVAENELERRLLDTGWESPGMATTLRRFRVKAEIFSEANVPLLSEEQAAVTRYGEIVGGLAVEFDGKERTLAQLAPYRAAPDRATRESAWRAGMAAMGGVREALDDLFDELMPLRRRIAANAGLESYRDYKWRQLARLDYGPDDAIGFQEAILEAVVPILERRNRRRAEALGLEALRPWDTEVDIHGEEPLRPFDSGRELADGTIRIFDRVSPELGAMARVMQDEELLDLENRKGKAPGGYCASLPRRGRPFIFMNAVGTCDNLNTMLHETGHAFHVFERQHQPYVWQRYAPTEFAEVASMTMELLTAPYLEKAEGGFYRPREAVRARIQHLERIITFLPYMATVDAFQHWLYTHPVTDRAERDAAWLGLHERFNVGVDWRGHEATRESLWHHKLHIFQVPFYYIEYGLAQLGALQVWRNSLSEPERALEQYRSALALGGTRTLPELFAAAGARLAFDVATVAELMGLVEEHIHQLEGRLADPPAT